MNTVLPTVHSADLEANYDDYYSDSTVLENSRIRYQELNASVNDSLKTFEISIKLLAT